VCHAQDLKERKERGGALVGWRRGLDERGGDRFLFAALELPGHLDLERVAEWNEWTGRLPTCVLSDGPPCNPPG